MHIHESPERSREKLEAVEIARTITKEAVEHWLSVLYQGYL